MGAFKRGAVFDADDARACSASIAASAAAAAAAGGTAAKRPRPSGDAHRATVAQISPPALVGKRVRVELDPRAPPRARVKDTAPVRRGAPQYAPHPGVLGSFGITVARAHTLVADMRRVDALPAAAPSASPNVTNASLRTLRGSIDTDVISFYFNLIERASNNSVCCLDAVHTTSMPGGLNRGDGSSDRALSLRLGTRHLDRNVAACAHVPGHYISIFVNHAERNIYLFDPLGRRAAGSGRCRAVAASVNDWLREQRIRLGRAAEPNYNVILNIDDLPSQGDGISCGAYVCLYAYFRVLLGRWPSTADFGQQNHADMRIAIFDACMTGRLRRPIAAAGGGAGAAANVNNFFDAIDAARTRTVDGDVTFDIDNVDAAEQAAILDSFRAARAASAITARRVVL